MTITPLPMDGLYLVTTQPIEDERGSFARVFCSQEFKTIGLTKPLAQINLSQTVAPGSIRGMHFQHPPHAETKIVRCLRGSVFDIAVDLRQGSPTFLQWHGQKLTSENRQALFIPEGFAHGFQVLEPDSELLYLHTAPYSPDAEGGVRFDDPALSIEWPLPPSDLSERDRNHPLIDPTFKGIRI
ncbi:MULTISPECIES: dTDP-4-dehydrorhamnose 3,5-epimerase [unclassified Pseudodesulfovibrio]|uniref:dTDP-4-dehydrorhamnose 3,5-epimerase n=1 Tax=unclassified Pseudodesulfovibrio TaxID=2661612 RepID=UPI000FEC0F84|nr:MULTISPECIES: dTDP-4-dehydrorhamnose 3,5-epimerase [unclassified Pseudodesulfovibrio]MCJ2163210.1 dTDP-4-dehydrorhamnose 3,5-epimerase [Pseudodesulfovibrio sp. S3-i]RWU07193.1 dTDP-4-dehydrorhamnose 3,5-epimerase [Pseudodesulfovibrio sp. S3]